MLTTCRIVSITLLLAVLTSTPVMAETWESTRFEVFEGVPWNDDDSIVLEAGKFLHDYVELDEPKPASVPLTPQLRYEIEEYLAAVAAEYAKHFPSPRLEPLVTREDGVQAYRIYYFDIPGDNAALARYGNGCSDSNRFRIEVNAATLTRGGKITPKGYGDLAHELFHAVQRSTVAGRKSACPGGVGNWIIEGQAEAIGHDMARSLRRVEDDTQISRWGLRYYSEPLVIGPDGPRSRGYQTSSFWRYVAETHYLRSRGKRDAEARPGPDIPGDYDTDYSFLADLMSRSPAGSGPDAETRWLNDWTRSYFGTDLSRIFTDFVSVFAQYGDYRVDASKVPGPDPETWWREIGFGGSGDQGSKGCTTVRLDETNDDVSVTLNFEKLAARCVELDVGDTGTPLVWTIQAIARDKGALQQLRLAMAGGQQVATSAPIDDIPDASGAVAAWAFFLDPGEKQYLLVTNIAKEAQNTAPQDIGLRISLSGRDDNHIPPQTKRSASTTAAGDSQPGPPGASQTRARRQAEMGAAARGAGAASWYLDEYLGDCPVGAVTAACDSRTILKLMAGAPEQLMPDAAPAAALGGLAGQMMEMANVDMTALVSMAQFEQQAGSKVTITIPGIDYGFTGTFNTADIRISGTDESEGLISANPVPEYPTPPCVYQQPTGKVTIEEFTPFILRGSYSAQLVEGAVVRDVRKCPKKPVVNSISGRFVIAAPWTQDSRRELDVSWLKEDAYNDINQMLPAGIKAIDPGPSDGPPIIEIDEAPMPRDTADADEFGGCDCSCESIKKGMSMARNSMIGNGSGEEGALMMMCVGQCIAQIPEGCSLE